MNHFPRHKGFTLVEVMLALVIVALALTMIMTSMDGFMSSAHLRDKTLGHWIALNQVAEIRLEANWPDVGESNGMVEFAALEWEWEAVINETEFPQLRRIDVEVFYPGEETSIANASGFIGENRSGNTPVSPWGIN